MPFLHMQKNGHHISWTHLTDLYGKANFGSGLSLLPKVKRKHLHLNSYSRMRVNLAAQVSIYGQDVDTNIISFYFIIGTQLICS